MSNKILVWDLPTRTFHGLLALSFVGAFITDDSERYRDIHLLLGYILLALIGFRLIWGVVGTRYARFNSFWFKPSAIAGYVRSMFQGKPQHYIGHNPAGSIAIFLLLGLGLLCGLSGLAITNETGGEWLEELHELSANAMLAVVLAHIAGVFVSSFLHRENLARAMITGTKSGEPAEGIQRRHAWLALLLLAAVTATSYAYLYKDWAPPSLTPLARQKSMQLELAEGEAASVQALPGLLRILLRNLIDNAVRYTPAGTLVQVRVDREAGRPGITVSDNGPGIPAEECDWLAAKLDVGCG